MHRTGLVEGWWGGPSYDGVAAAQLINSNIFDIDMKTIAAYENGSMLPIEEAAYSPQLAYRESVVWVAAGLKLEEYKAILEDVCEKDKTCSIKSKYYDKKGIKPKKNLKWLRRGKAYVCSIL